ncbi:MAG: isoprenyl transferase [Bryobacterales bacterium]|nr:isoprenyl transferase [Bryobacterales bacterium]
MKALLESLGPRDSDLALALAIDPHRLPAHIAVIMDGNGRWANRRLLPRVAGHQAGIQPVRTIVESCAALGLEALTLYAFSVENWKRPRTEVDTLWSLLRVYLRKELATLQQNNVRLNAIGRIEYLSSTVREELESTIRATEGNTGLRLNMAINYSGKAELVDAANRLIAQARQAGTLESLHVTEESLAANLYTAGLPDPDLLIRTSGELRISNFLLWQIAYAEIYVTETFWPDFKRRDLLSAILDYQKRERRFGGLGAVDAPALVEAAR